MQKIILKIFLVFLIFQMSVSFAKSQSVFEHLLGQFIANAIIPEHWDFRAYNDEEICDRAVKNGKWNLMKVR